VSVIAEFTAPSNSLALGQCIENQSDAETDLDDVTIELDISSSAYSVLLRRGHKQLLKKAI